MALFLRGGRSEGNTVSLARLQTSTENYLSGAKIIMQRNIVFAAIALLGVGVLSASPASAAGCNGVVNQFVWGCAAWDNNNGPQFPNYKPPKQAAQPAPRPTPVVPQQAQREAQRPQAVVRDGGRVVSNDGAGIVARGGGNAVNRSGIVAGGGGNAVNKSGLVGQDGASLIGDGGGTMHRK